VSILRCKLETAPQPQEPRVDFSLLPLEQAPFQAVFGQAQFGLEAVSFGAFERIAEIGGVLFLMKGEDDRQEFIKATA
jgi:hypothetical protein